MNKYKYLNPYKRALICFLKYIKYRTKTNHSIARHIAKRYLVRSRNTGIGKIYLAKKLFDQEHLKQVF